MVGGTEEDVRDGVRWRQMIQCGDALKEQLKNKEVVTQVTCYWCIFMIIYCRPSQDTTSHLMLCFGNLKDSPWKYSLTVGSHFEYAQSELLDDTERRATFTFICFRCYCRADIKKQTNKQTDFCQPLDAVRTCANSLTDGSCSQMSTRWGELHREMNNIA